MSAAEPLPASVRSLDERADRELAMLDRLRPSTLSTAIRQAGHAPEAPAARAPMFSGGDSGESGEAAPHKALSRPRVARPRGERGDKHPGAVTDDADTAPAGEVIGARFGEAGEPLAHFLLREHGKGPGVHWVGLKTSQSEGVKVVTGHEAPQWICSPLRVAAHTRDGEGNEWGRLLVFPDRDRREHRWAMPMRMLAGSGDELRGELYSQGLLTTLNPGLRRLVGDYIQRVRPDVTARCVKRTGWHGDVFVLPREAFGDTDAEPVLFQAATMEGVTLGQAGTLAGWIENVAAPCAGNTRLVLAICAGFAGPCLGLLGTTGGGFNLRGGSSTGKTTALLVAASLFGSPDYLRTWRHTANAQEGAAALHSDLLLILDELGQLDPRDAGQAAYTLANGQGKGRAARDGSPRAITTWRVLFLSSGEVSLADLVTQAGDKVRAGQEVRVIDLPADAGAGLGLFDTVPEGMSAGAFADAIKAAAGKHYGHALPAFLRVLVADPAKAREALAALRDAVMAELVDTNATGQVRRVAERFALVAAAGELATTYRLTGWQTGEATRAASACFAAWLAGRGTDKASEPVAMLAQVRAFLSAHGEARFTSWNADDRAPRTINRAGFRKGDADGPTYYVEPEAFRHEVCAGFDYQAVAKVLAEAGALATGGDARPTQKLRLPDGRNARVYVITPALWGEE